MFEVVQADSCLDQPLEELAIWLPVPLPDLFETIVSLKELPLVELPDTPEKKLIHSNRV